MGNGVSHFKVSFTVEEQSYNQTVRITQVRLLAFLTHGFAL